MACGVIQAGKISGMKLLQLHFAWVLLLLVIFGTGCQKFDKLEDLELSERDAEYAVPVFRTSTSLQDVLEEFDSNTVVQIQPVRRSSSLTLSWHCPLPFPMVLI